VTRSIEDGWKSLEAYGLPNTMIKDELWAMLANVKRLNNPASQRELVRFLQPYTKFFKTYATATPGFHVRNGMSNVMTMVASGADIRLFRRSFSLFRDFTDHVTSGGQAAVEAWLAKMPEQERSLFTWSMKAADAAGGGRVDEAIREALSSQGKAADLIYHNRMIRASQHLGHHVEQSARFMLAYDTLVQGMRAGERVGTMFSHEDLFLQAQARVKRYLFDYVDKSAVDESVKQIIPFWTWMSRNVPMQLVNQWTNPRAYAIYQSVVRNFAHDTSGTITPTWLKEAGAFNIGGDTYLQPDFGSTRMDQFMTQLGDPARMASMVNPAIRLPVELLGGRKLYNNSPFSTTPQRVAGGPVSGLTESLLGLIGATDQVGPKGVKDAQGNVIPAGTNVTSDKWNYALMNLLPIFSQAERLFPSTDAYQGKKDASWLSYFGVPVKQVTKGQKDAEVASRKKQIQQLASAAKKLGYTP
jgi:hypothetical protein